MRHDFEIVTTSAKVITIEVFDENSTLANTSIGTSSFEVDAIVNHSLDEDFEYSLEVRNKKGRVTGTVKLFLCWLDTTAIHYENLRLNQGQRVEISIARGRASAPQGQVPIAGCKRAGEG